MLGDSYGAAVVEALSRKELEAMDSEAGVKKVAGEGGVGGADEEALIGLYKTESGSTGSNGSSVKVREVHFVLRHKLVEHLLSPRN